MKKVFLVLALLLLVVSVTACNKVDKSSDAYRFKEEYESLNGEDNGNGKTIRTISIDEDNPFVYASSDEIAQMMDENKTFVVYFGFAKCPWCRSMIEQLVKSAKDNNIDKIYYVDVLEIRDTYQLNDEGYAEKTKEGTEGYNALIEKMGNVLTEYTLSDEDGNKVEVGEKRIYAPNVVVVVKGKAEKMVEGISEKLEDPYSKLTDEMKEESYNSFKCLWECITEGANICKKNAC